MTLSWASRVVRGGSAVETVYWRATNVSDSATNKATSSGAKLVKHGRVLRLKQSPPPPANLHHRLTTSGPASTT